jgi:hypothetical protein
MRKMADAAQGVVDGMKAKERELEKSDLNAAEPLMTAFSKIPAELLLRTGVELPPRVSSSHNRA